MLVYQLAKLHRRRYDRRSETLLNGLDGEAYQRHVLERIAECPVSRAHELLPGHVTAEIGRTD